MLPHGVFSVALDASTEENEHGPAWPLCEFVGDDESALARIAAHAILENTRRYNPLVLCGPTGVGKSHLLHGLVRRWRASHPDEKPVVTTGADFARNYAYAVQTDTLVDHRTRILRASLFVLDSLDDLVKKPAAQQELMHTIDAAVAEDVQVLVASRKPLIPGGAFLPGLASRLSAGLVVPLALPGQEARRVILRKIRDRQPAPITDEAIEVLAAKLTGTARELRHAVLQLCETTPEEQRPVDVEAVRRLIAEWSNQRRPTLTKIATQVARRFRLKVADLQGKTRRREVVQARGVAMLLGRRLTGASYETVGRHFGGRDHSTVMHACRRTAELLDADPLLQRTVEELVGSWRE